jgi:peroxiredoxin
MTAISISLIAFIGLLVSLGCWCGWQMLRQNGRMLLRLDELEKRLDEFEFEEPDDEPRSNRGDEARYGKSDFRNPKSEMDQTLVTSAAASRFSNRSLARSKIKRDGLKAGTTAPSFRLPRADGRGELALEQLRGRHLLLVFSDPNCGPCQVLAPQLEEFHRGSGAGAVFASPEGGDREISSPPQLVVITRGDPKKNRAKIKELGLTFPVLLQRQWEISRLYAMFATPMAYLIDDQGVILNDVAVGVEPIRALMSKAMKSVNHLTGAALAQE